MTIASIVGVILAIAGLVFAALQYRDAQKLADDLLVIRDSLSTRFIGEFPSYIPNITELIKQARNEIIIVSPVPSYGHFSSHRAYIDYRNAITTKLAEGVFVSFICHGRDQRMQRFRQRFLGSDGRSAAENWASKLRGDDFQERIKAFIKREEPSLLSEISERVTPELLPFEKFESLVEAVHDRTLRNDFRNTVLNCTSVELPVYFWVVDGKRAVFSIANYGVGESGLGEIGFITSDSKLISALKVISNKYVTSAPSAG